MLGKTAETLDQTGPVAGKVFMEGEYWNAISETPVPAGTKVEVVAIEGLTLKVRPRIT